MKRFFMMAVIAVLAVGLGFAQNAAALKAQSGLNLRGALRQRVMKNLNLSDAQKAQVKAIQQAAKAKAQPVRELWQKNRTDLRAAIKADNETQIQQLAAAAGILQGQLVEIRSSARAKLLAVLTPDQRATLSAMTTLLKELQAKRAGKAPIL